MVFTNISSVDALMPGMALTGDRNVKQAKVLKENIGKNGMPSDVSEIARRTEYSGKSKDKPKTGSKEEKKDEYIPNGAPSGTKKPSKLILLKPNKRPTISAKPGTNGMPSSVNYPTITKYKKKK